MATNKKTIFWTDLILAPLLILTIFSGLKLHVAGHSAIHEVWHNWAVFHVISSIAFMLTAALHLKHHWRWYKSLLKRLKGKSNVTLILSVLFAIVVLTGFYMLFFTEGANTFTGLLHYGIGLIMGVMGLWHILKRIRIAIKGLKKA